MRKVVYLCSSFGALGEHVAAFEFDVGDGVTVADAQRFFSTSYTRAGLPLSKGDLRLQRHDRLVPEHALLDDVVEHRDEVEVVLVRRSDEEDDKDEDEEQDEELVEDLFGSETECSTEDDEEDEEEDAEDERVSSAPASNTSSPAQGALRKGARGSRRSKRSKARKKQSKAERAAVARYSSDETTFDTSEPKMAPIMAKLPFYMTITTWRHSHSDARYFQHDPGSAATAYTNVLSDIGGFLERIKELILSGHVNDAHHALQGLDEHFADYRETVLKSPEAATLWLHVMLQRAEVYNLIKLSDKAHEVLDRVEELISQDSATVSRWDVFQQQFERGLAFFHAGDLVKAQHHLTQAQDTADSIKARRGSKYRRKQELYTECSIWLARAYYADAMFDYASLPDAVLDSKAKKVAARRQPRSRNKAISILEDLIRVDETHPGALGHYSKIAVDMGRVRDVTAYLTRALVNVTSGHLLATRRDLRKLQRDYRDLILALTAQVASRPGGVDAIMDGLTRPAPVGLFFLADKIRLYGAVRAAIELSQRGLAACKPTEPVAAQLTQNQVTGLECIGESQRAFVTLQGFLTINRSFTFNLSKQPVIGFLQLIRGVKRVDDPKCRTGKADTSSVPAYCEVKPLVDAQEPQVYIPFRQDNPKNIMLFVQHEIDMLGLIMTAVQLLFVHGALQPIPKMIEWIERVRTGSPSWMNTNVKETHAYYTLIAKLMPLVPFPLPPNRMPAVVRVMGDAHCLVPAWHEIYFGGQPHLLEPVFIPGLKCEVLEPDRDSPARVALYNALRRIPPFSNVIFFCGDADCREEVVRLTTNYVYQSQQSCVDALVDRYVRFLETVASQYNLHIFVHPVPPVISEVLANVILFNERLEKRVRQGSGNLHWLDLSQSPPFLRLGPETPVSSPHVLDATHLHPSYVPQLEAAMQRAVDEIEQEASSEAVPG